mmetsp:Transcript_45541/g.77363  ORF Transcript_45541/g.77363 Transcript_45541/m.77363 type:complete len:283 (-) Transcript_45541:651-1499(-)
MPTQTLMLLGGPPLKMVHGRTLILSTSKYEELEQKSYVYMSNSFSSWVSTVPSANTICLGCERFETHAIEFSGNLAMGGTGPFTAAATDSVSSFDSCAATSTAGSAADFKFDKFLSVSGGVSLCSWAVLVAVVRQELASNEADRASSRSAVSPRGATLKRFVLEVEATPTATDEGVYASAGTSSVSATSSASSSSSLVKFRSAAVELRDDASIVTAGIPKLDRPPSQVPGDCGGERTEVPTSLLDMCSCAGACRGKFGLGVASNGTSSGSPSESSSHEFNAF